MAVVVPDGRGKPLDPRGGELARRLPEAGLTRTHDAGPVAILLVDRKVEDGVVRTSTSVTARWPDGFDKRPQGVAPGYVPDA